MEATDINCCRTSLGSFWTFGFGFVFVFEENMVGIREEG